MEHNRSLNQSFDICVPSWNSLEYLKLMVAGIRKHSSLKHVIRVHDNGSTDGTQEWLTKQQIPFTRSEENEGFCGINHALKKAQTEHVMMFNTDMIPLPGWDLEIVKQINYFKRRNIKAFTISSCLIEPAGGNPEYDQSDWGKDAATYNEAGLLKHFKDNMTSLMSRHNTNQYSHPVLMPTDMLKRCGYLDVSYFPGWAVDHDIAARAYFQAECRHFVMLGKSRVYHFSSKTFSKLPPEVKAKHGEDIFLNNWGISVQAFRSRLKVKSPYVTSSNH